MFNQEIVSFLKSQSYFNHDLNNFEPIKLHQNKEYNFNRNIFSNILKNYNPSKKFIKSTNTENSNDQLFTSKFFKMTKISNEKIYKNSIFLEINHEEPLFFSFCLLVYNKFIYYDDDVKIQFLEKLKKFLGIEFDKYKQNYKSKINKTLFMNQLLNNEIITANLLLHFIGDYFNINFILIDNENNENFYNKFIKNRGTIIIYEKQSKYYIEFNYDNISIHSGQQLISKNIIKKPIHESLLNKNLKDLQQIALSKNITIKKQGKKNFINKKKEELMNEINNIDELLNS